MRRTKISRTAPPQLFVGSTDEACVSPWMSWNVRNASHTTYALRDTPSQIRITNPIHPLRERTLEVVYSRRQGRETHWIVRLPDGSCAQIPSAWTDHPRGVVPTERLRAGGRATPSRLRHPY